MEKMGLFDKIKGMLNGDEEPEQELDELENDIDEEPSIDRPSRGMSINAAALELKVVKPDSYPKARQIADHLLNHRTVVLNLEATNKETARRILDFLTGVTYSINGSLKSVANNTYVITPDNVSVSGDPASQKAAVAAQPVDTDTAATTTVDTVPQKPASFSGDTLY